jgi:hypothetical protein
MGEPHTDTDGDAARPVVGKHGLLTITIKAF